MIDAAVEGFAWAMAELGSNTPAGALERHGDATVLVSGAAVPSLNYVMVMTQAPDPADVASAATAIQAYGVPWGMEFRHAPTDEIIALAAGLGLGRHTRPQFMTVRPEDLVRRRTALTIETVGPEHWEEYTDVLTRGFEAPAGIFGATMGGPVLGLPGFRGYLARTADGAVGTALSTVKDGALCVFNVAVRPSARGRGIGRALTEAALAQDFTVACLQSSTAGRPLYESMGFRAAERWHTLEPA
ncbi:hypothetical protein GCM10022223_30130 [Kineosporia mesophila]|uniref:N-acetyltransferase domain-containing protein n=1 Tax=Kineosporia mesophila TaxID=566012 RepID=A0ABP6ZKX7_9ACTN|nr:GNAT family N-acetyltransferase [Kineosporia mesophila]